MAAITCNWRCGSWAQGRCMASRAVGRAAVCIAVAFFFGPQLVLFAAHMAHIAFLSRLDVDALALQMCTMCSHNTLPPPTTQYTTANDIEPSCPCAVSASDIKKTQMRALSIEVRAAIIIVLYTIAVAMLVFGKAVVYIWPLVMPQSVIDSGRAHCDVLASAYSLCVGILITSLYYIGSPFWAADSAATAFALATIASARAIARRFFGIGWSSWLVTASAAAALVAFSGLVRRMLVACESAPLSAALDAPCSPIARAQLDTAASLGLAAECVRRGHQSGFYAFDSVGPPLAIVPACSPSPVAPLGSAGDECLVKDILRAIGGTAETTAFVLSGCAVADYALLVVRTLVVVSLPWLALTEYNATRTVLGLTGIATLPFPSAGAILTAPVIDAAVVALLTAPRNAYVRAFTRAADTRCVSAGYACALKAHLCAEAASDVYLGGAEFARWTIFPADPSAQRITRVSLQCP